MLKKHTAITPAAAAAASAQQRNNSAAAAASSVASSAQPVIAAVSASSAASAAAASVAPVGAWVTPGDLLGSTTDGMAPGFGCYVLAGQAGIYAGVVGVKAVTKLEGAAAAAPAAAAVGAKQQAQQSPQPQARFLVHIENARQPARLPVVGDVVTCRVTKINARMASVEILCLHSHHAVAPAESSAAAASAAASASGLALATPAAETYLLEESLAGTIRQRDVRAHEIDSVEIYRSFRPLDLVRAQVLSLGDARSYFLSTARNDLGVILATSPAGAPMVPINWEQMQCPLTGAKEYRKVAKIDA